MLPNFLRGKVELIAEAYDTPSIAVPGEWAGMPVAPALLTWRVQNLGGKVVVKEQVAVDFRQTIPPNGQFWSYYAGARTRTAVSSGRTTRSASPAVSCSS